MLKFKLKNLLNIKLKNPIPLDFTRKEQGFGLLLVGIILALVLGSLAHIFGRQTDWIWWILAVGVVVGISNLFHEEGVLFVLTLLTLTFMLNLLAGLTIFPVWAITLFKAVMYLFAPVATLVSLKVLYALAVK